MEEAESSSVAAAVCSECRRHCLERLAKGRLIEIDYSARGATDADQDVYLFRTVKPD